MTGSETGHFYLGQKEDISILVRQVDIFSLTVPPAPPKIEAALCVSGTLPGM